MGSGLGLISGFGCRAHVDELVVGEKRVDFELVEHRLHFGVVKETLQVLDLPWGLLCSACIVPLIISMHRTADHHG